MNKFSATAMILVSALTTSIVVGLLSNAKSQASHKIIKTNELMIADDNGRVRASIGTVPDGSPVLVFYDKAHKPTLSLLSPALGPMVLVYGQDGKSRATITITGNGDPAVYLINAAGKKRVITP